MKKMFLAFLVLGMFVGGCATLSPPAEITFTITDPATGEVETKHVVGADVFKKEAEKARAEGKEIALVQAYKPESKVGNALSTAADTSQLIMFIDWLSR